MRFVCRSEGNNVLAFGSNNYGELGLGEGARGRTAMTGGAALGVGLNARGALEIVIATVGLSLGVLNDRSYTVIVLMAMATSMAVSTAAVLAAATQASVLRRTATPSPLASLPPCLPAPPSSPPLLPSSP